MQVNLEEDEAGPERWSADRQSGLDRLRSFLPQAGNLYSSGRNYDHGPENRKNVSCLSPWIRHRLVLEKEVLSETLSCHSVRNAEKFIQEVFWRTYFKGWLEHHPTVWSQYCKGVADAFDDMDQSSDFRSRYNEAVSGQTGIDCFDTWAQELVETGYLHNHSRMWFASIWIFTLELPWQLGADFFYRHLLDGDPASNTLSWRWVAGLHTKGKNYIARRANIERYTGGRFSPIGLNENAAPLYESTEHPTQPLPLVETLLDAGQFGLVITDEDCHPESLSLPMRANGICGLMAQACYTPLKSGNLAMQFKKEALKNAIERATGHFECAAKVSDKQDWGALLVKWAREINVSTLVMAWNPIGSARHKTETAQPILDQAGIKLIRIIRDYDALCWPYANRGYFKLKNNIPKILQELTLL